MPDQVRSLRLLSGDVKSGVGLTNYHRTPTSGIQKEGLIYYLDAGNPLSYPGDGTTWTDLSSSAKNATLTSGPTFQPTNGGTISFDGTDDYAVSSLVTNATTNVTMQAWVYIGSTSLKGSIICNGRNSGYAIGVGDSSFDGLGNNLVMLFPSVRWIGTNTALGTGWKFITMRMNATSVPSCFINMTFLGGFSGSNPSTPATDTYINRTPGDEPLGARALACNIALVAIYSRLFTTSDVCYNYNATKGRFGL